MPNTLIKTADELHALLQRWDAADYIAVDTEFLRERTYFPKLCLLQMCWQGEAVAVDVLSIDELSSLQRFINAPERVKIFHSARQDLELLLHEWGEVPRPLFDTQVAADLVGTGNKSGYARLVNAMLGVELPKDVTRSKWCERPLSEQQLAYAYDDVIWLEKLYLQLRDALVDLEREAWLREEMGALEQEGLHRVDPEVAWLRIKGRNRLDSRQLAILQQLARWREQRAIEKDLPRKWVLGDGFLLEVAQHQPATMQQLKQAHGAGKRQFERYASKVLELVAAGLAIPENDLVSEAPPPRLNATQKQELAALEEALEAYAGRHHLASGIVASRRALRDYVIDHSLERFTGWRQQVMQAMIATI